jgi:hypothetical protein
MLTASVEAKKRPSPPPTQFDRIEDKLNQMESDLHYLTFTAGKD